MAASLIKKSFCTTREAAMLLGISLRTAQKWVESGLLDGWKTQGGHRRIRRASIERLLADSGHSSSASAPDRDVFQVLVVEDNEDLLKLYRLNLSQWPLRHRLTTASNGFEALIRMGNERPDLLVADLFMPDFDGFMMLRSIRGVPEFRNLPIVVVTGLSHGDIVARGGLPEDIQVLSKPIPFAQLQHLAEGLARQRQTQR